MDFKDLTAIIDFAISQEVEAFEFYRSVADKEALVGKRTMFLKLAAEEEKHRRLLENFKIGDVNSTIDKYKFTWIIDIKRSNYVAGMVYTPGMSYRDILMLAAKREEKALELYNLLLNKVEDETARKVFKILCQEEAKHKLELEGELDAYMASMGD